MYNKAIAAVITPLIVGLLAPLGISAETTVATAIELIVIAIATGVTVYLIPNKVQ
jgi:hypothetical protein